ncbi:MAG TPA: hypothetical protein VF721_10175 [Pyrinomonadaceae bacterium]|jgi:hypothetical protein
MPNFSQSNSRVLFRAVLLCGVLAGLLFSCGEGIRLFPFPPVASPNKYSGWQSDGHVKYQENAQRFENKQGNQHSKIQRDNQTHYWTGAYDALHNAPPLAVSHSLESGVLFNSGVFKSSFFAADAASRAPPFSA